MKTWTTVRVMALLALVAAPLAAQETIKAGAEKAKDAVVAGAEKTKDAVVAGAKTVAGKTKDGLSKTGELMTDAWITTRIHSRFVGEHLLKDSDINVDSDNHVVTLKGTVMAQTGRARAASIAMRTEGVRRVVNHLTIGPKHAA